MDSEVAVGKYSREPSKIKAVSHSIVSLASRLSGVASRGKLSKLHFYARKGTFGTFDRHLTSAQAYYYLTTSGMVSVSPARARSAWLVGTLGWLVT